ncbi:MAG: hypothetical protein MUP16_06125, partial [Sedimentisphaerales bacterium]|nr:hypothetical protein [Sedimentisphaerales bacterium]
MPMNLIELLFEKRKDFTYWCAFACLGFGIAGWLLIGTIIQEEQEKLIYQLLFAFFMSLIFVAGITINHVRKSPKTLPTIVAVILVFLVVVIGAILYCRFFIPQFIFPKDVAGILVLRINGDDANNSLQRELVSNLNLELSKEAPKQRIEVRADDTLIDEGKGLPQSKQKAKELGKKQHALLVIWGNKIAEKKTFYPHITIVNEDNKSIIAGERTLGVQNISELTLPEELVDQPIYLTHFVAGYSFYDQHQYQDAVEHFELALSRKGSLPGELAYLHFFAGYCHYCLAQGQKTMDTHLRTAIRYYEAVVNYFEPNRFPQEWATAQNNLGIAYADLPTGDRTENLKKANAAYEATLRVWIEKDFPVDWAITQNNLGTAYAA